LIIGWRASIIVMIAIPTSILIALGFVDIADYGLQQMTIAGLVIALGLLVDNAIVVTENISRFIQEGYSHAEAAAKGTGTDCLGGSQLHHHYSTGIYPHDDDWRCDWRFHPQYAGHRCNDADRITFYIVNLNPLSLESFFSI
ncbi:MAG: hypothetical protein GQ561_07365, partial [Calditrichae bacterium]|nr:hypothetical protein [Calditrichia bacterium]